MCEHVCRVLTCLVHTATSNLKLGFKTEIISRWIRELFFKFEIIHSSTWIISRWFNLTNIRVNLIKSKRKTPLQKKRAASTSSAQFPYEEEKERGEEGEEGRQWGVIRNTGLRVIVWANWGCTRLYNFRWGKNFYRKSLEGGGEGSPPPHAWLTLQREARWCVKWRWVTDGQVVDYCL